jgi:valyl-tRNA synthetase
MKTLELDKNYTPRQVEDKWYEEWEQNNAFSPGGGEEPFCIVIPPPNITGSLHMGHALNNTLQDILIRFHRMMGFSALWIPGTDHAGIATQRVVEKQLASQGTNRWQIGREEFVKRVWEWKEKFGGTIVNQLRRMGCSCDWDKLRFTLDGGCSRAVREAFVRLYDKGLIYRGKRIINWCPHCLTALSDLEVEHKNIKGKLYHLRYPGGDGGPGITIATTRPETILADTAVAVNPEDPRYKEMVGGSVILPIVGRKLPVIADSYVDIEFGTGALKITPAHDANDYQVGARHGLPTIQVIDEKGIMNEEAGRYQGQERFRCREEILNDLEAGGFLVKVQDYDMAVGTCYRCDTVIEPYLSEQWFVSCSELAKPAIKAVKEGRTKFHPERFGKVYLNWMENLLDWCISRQLWWGHRIPIWTCESCGHEGAYKEDPEKCGKCGSGKIRQDENVLDTWFSSGLWPFSTMGWPDSTPDLEKFYPTSVLITDRGIIFLWVARMMMFGYEFMGDAPFDDVIIHATILNKEGVRMSKSLGTGIDPLDLFDKYGTDATRFGLAIMTEQGQDIRFAEERIEMSRNFANKIWNASRYLLRFLEKSHASCRPAPASLKLWDSWILSRLTGTISSVTNSLMEYQFDDAVKSLYSFFWDDFCDWYIEITKPILYGESQEDRNRTLHILEKVMDSFLRLAHPVMPHITEEIWSFLPAGREKPGSLLITSPWPEEEPEYENPEAEKEFSLVMEVIKALRNLRAEGELTPRQAAPFLIEAQDPGEMKILQDSKDIIAVLAVAGSISISTKQSQVHKKSLSARVGEIDLFMPLEGLVDVNRELDRLKKEMEKEDGLIRSLEAKCQNPAFVSKARPEVVEKEKMRLAEAREKRERILQRIKLFQAEDLE